MADFRLEHDLIGSKEVPASCYYGIQTLRAVENFPITGIPMAHYPLFVHALAQVKKAAALTNFELGLLSSEISEAVGQACDEILAGQWHDQFVVDVIQGGGGTSANMNANEVIANRALEILGYERGRYDVVHPNSHVNMSQSTNDVYPSALRLAISGMLDTLIEEMGNLQRAFAEKGVEFAGVIKMGRTCLQDAVPITLGQGFEAYAGMVADDIQRLIEARSLIREINMGGTAVGTGLNTHPDYATIVTEKLRELTGIPVVKAANLILATQDTGDYVQLSGVLKRSAAKLSKICDDLRLLSSGPRAGLNEINLPQMAPGSSIMPGKVNPVIPEVVNQIAFQVIGNDTAVTMAAAAGQLELNVMEPIIAYNLFTSIDILRRGCRILTERCIQGITSNEAHCRQMVENSIGLVTVLNPVIGYASATAIAQEAVVKNCSIIELVLEKNLLSQVELNDLLKPENMTAPKNTPIKAILS